MRFKIFEILIVVVSKYTPNGIFSIEIILLPIFFEKHGALSTMALFDDFSKFVAFLVYSTMKNHQICHKFGKKW